MRTFTFFAAIFFAGPLAPAATRAPNAQVTLDRTGRGSITIFGAPETKTCFAIGSAQHSPTSIVTPAGQYRSIEKSENFRPLGVRAFYSDATLFFALYLYHANEKPYALQIYGSPALNEVHNRLKSLREIPNTFGDIATEQICATKLKAIPTPKLIKIVYE